jgi:hypothetical protein
MHWLSVWKAVSIDARSDYVIDSLPHFHFVLVLDWDRSMQAVRLTGAFD